MMLTLTSDMKMATSRTARMRQRRGSGTSSTSGELRVTASRRCCPMLTTPGARRPAPSAAVVVGAWAIVTFSSRRIGHRAARSAWLVWLVGAGAYFLAYLHRASLGVAGPTAVERLDISATELGSFVMVQLGLYALMQVPAGVAIDRWGARKVLLASTLVMGTAQLLFAFATSFPVALAARALLGVGDAAVFIAVLRLAAMWFPHRRYAVLTSLTGLVGMLGNLVATVPLVLALDALGWTRTFALTAVASLGYALLLLRPTVAAPFRQLAPVEPDGSPARRPALRGIGATWGRRETRLGFWTHQATMAPGVVVALVWGYPYLTEALGYPDARAASLLSLYVLATVAFSFLVGPLAGRRPTWRAPMAVGISLAGVLAVALLVLWPGGRPPSAVVTAVFVVFAIGGPGSQIGFHIARDYNPAARISTATGLVNAGGFAGAMVAAVAVGMVLDARSGSAAPSLLDYRWAVSVIGVIAVVSTLAMVLTLLGVRADVRDRMDREEPVVVPVTERWWDRAYRRLARRPRLA
ncbi:MFS transporter [Georgenia wutianyii]|uniref:MFS transporter n=1 Tax=Georgenia wutianyii TaxID=2585135 RepID=A0ABX5VP54_9MICO|nr:MFS transporter [Georgenia wutianyii]